MKICKSLEINSSGINTFTDECKDACEKGRFWHCKRSYVVDSQGKRCLVTMGLVERTIFALFKQSYVQVWFKLWKKEGDAKLMLIKDLNSTDQKTKRVSQEITSSDPKMETPQISEVVEELQESSEEELSEPLQNTDLVQTAQQYFNKIEQAKPEEIEKLIRVSTLGLEREEGKPHGKLCGIFAGQYGVKHFNAPVLILDLIKTTKEESEAKGVCHISSGVINQRAPSALSNNMIAEILRFLTLNDLIAGFTLPDLYDLSSQFAIYKTPQDLPIESKGIWTKAKLFALDEKFTAWLLKFNDWLLQSGSLKDSQEIEEIEEEIYQRAVRLIISGEVLNEEKEELNEVIPSVPEKELEHIEELVEKTETEPNIVKGLVPPKPILSTTRTLIVLDEGMIQDLSEVDQKRARRLIQFINARMEPKEVLLPLDADELEVLQFLIDEGCIPGFKGKEKMDSKNYKISFTSNE